MLEKRDYNSFSESRGRGLPRWRALRRDWKLLHDTKTLGKIHTSAESRSETKCFCDHSAVYASLGP